MQLYKQEKKIQSIETQRPALSKLELESVLNCLIEDQIGSGEITKKFEKIFANTLGFKHALAVNNLTSAYHLAYLSRNVGPKDYIIMSALAPVSAADAANYTGAQIVLLDIGRDSFHPETATVNDAIKKIQEQMIDRDDSNGANVYFILEHSFGSVFNPDINYLKKNNIIIIEDITGLVGKRIEKNGDYYGKNSDICLCGLSQYDLLTTGNGAMILQDDQKLHSKTLVLRYGVKRKKGSIAYDYRLEDFQSAIGLNQLSRLGELLNRRSGIGKKYLESLRNSKHTTCYKDPAKDTYLNFPVIFSKNPDEVQRYYASLQIGIKKACPLPLHHLLDTARMEFANTERFYQKGFSIPAYPALTANNIERIAASLRGIL